MSEFRNSLFKYVLLFRKVSKLAIPFGRRKLFVVFLLSLLQGLAQVAGVTSIIPFLGLAASPVTFRKSDFGQSILTYFPEKTDEQLIVYAGVFGLIMLLVSNIVNLLAETHRTLYVHRYGHWLRMRMLNQITIQPFSYFTNNNSAIFQKKATSDVLNYTAMVFLPILDSIARLISIAFIMIALVCVNPKITLIVVPVITGFYVCAFLIFTPARARSSELIKKSYRRLNVLIRELFDGIKPIKIHKMEDAFLAGVNAQSFALSKVLPRPPLISSLPRYLLEPVLFGSVIVVTIIHLINGRELVSILPSLGVFALAGYRLMPAVQLLYSQASGITAMDHCLDEVYDEFESAALLTSDERENRQAAAAISWNEKINLKDLCFTHQGNVKPVLNEVTVTFEKNQAIGIVGDSGAGKSTLIDIILGLHKPTSGKVEIDGKELTAELIPSWREGIGYIPQELFILDASIAENVAFGIERADIDEERLASSCRLAALDEHDFEEGYQSMVGEAGSLLSGGQKQRIGIARALYRNPSVIILDEATSSLDQETERSILKAIEQMKGALTIFIVSHRPLLLELCDEVFELRDGQLIKN